MKAIRTKLKKILPPSLWEGVGVGLLLLTSCDGRQTLANVAEEDSLCIDTVATLDDVAVADTVAVADSLIQDSL